MTFTEWLTLGIERGWIVGEPYCGAHDVPPFTDDEDAAYREAFGDDVDMLDRCATVVRIEPGPHLTAVEPAK